MPAENKFFFLHFISQFFLRARFPSASVRHALESAVGGSQTQACSRVFRENDG